MIKKIKRIPDLTDYAVYCGGEQQSLTKSLRRFLYSQVLNFVEHQ
jgi:hypothetical protein